MRCIESPYYHENSSLPQQQATPPAATLLTTPRGRPLSMSYFNGSRISEDSLPDAVDWRTQGAVTDIKDQVGAGLWGQRSSGNGEGD